MLHCQQLTNNAFAIPMLIHASVIQQLPCMTSFNISNSLQRNFKNVLQNCADRPIGECMREKYVPFRDTNLTLLFTLFKHLSIKTICRKDSSHFRGTGSHITGKLIPKWPSVIFLEFVYNSVRLLIVEAYLSNSLVIVDATQTGCMCRQSVQLTAFVVVLQGRCVCRHAAESDTFVGMLCL